MILEKLKGQGKTFQAFHVPENYQEELSGFPKEKSYDLILNFVYSLEEMDVILQKTFQEQALNKGGRLYFAHPKLSSKKYAGIHRDAIFPFLKVDDATGLIAGLPYRFNQMLSLDEDFTLIGVKYDEKPKKAVNRVEDYEKFVPELKEKISAANEKTGEFFASLTMGYQKDWARFCYSAKQEKTRVARFEKMMLALNDGIKSSALMKKK